MNLSVEQRIVSCTNRNLEYHLTRKKVKNVNMRIKPDGRILVSANRSVPVTFIDEFVRQKQDYIIAALKKYEEMQKQVIAGPTEYSTGESIGFMGERLKLKVLQGVPERVFLEEGVLCLNVRDVSDWQRKKRMTDRWLKQKQQEIFTQICREIYPLFVKYGIAYPEIKIRSMTSCWGLCRPGRGRITLNSRLLAAPRSSIEYVVLHEFAHFLHPNHSRKFYEEIAMHMPDWKERKKALENVK